MRSDKRFSSDQLRFLYERLNNSIGICGELLAQPNITEDVIIRIIKESGFGRSISGHDCFLDEVLVSKGVTDKVLVALLSHVVLTPIKVVKIFSHKKANDYVRRELLNDEVLKSFFDGRHGVETANLEALVSLVRMSNSPDFALRFFEKMKDEYGFVLDTESHANTVVQFRDCHSCNNAFVKCVEIYFKNGNRVDPRVVEMMVDWIKVYPTTSKYPGNDIFGFTDSVNTYALDCDALLNALIGFDGLSKEEFNQLVDSMPQGYRYLAIADDVLKDPRLSKSKLLEACHSVRLSKGKADALAENPALPTDGLLAIVSKCSHKGHAKIIEHRNVDELVLRLLVDSETADYIMARAQAALRKRESIAEAFQEAHSTRLSPQPRVVKAADQGVVRPIRLSDESEPRYLPDVPPSREQLERDRAVRPSSVVREEPKRFIPASARSPKQKN